MPRLDAAIIRFLWSVVEKQAQFISGLNDEAIKTWLVRQVQERIFLSPEEIEEINHYIRLRLMLIRDIAESCAANSP
ncbi:MAG: hypothetical protein AAGD25_10600 [Cyanobacteria bacterium P01_F01_bin.150]